MSKQGSNRTPRRKASRPQPPTLHEQLQARAEQRYEAYRAEARSTFEFFEVGGEVALAEDASAEEVVDRLLAAYFPGQEQLAALIKPIILPAFEGLKEAASKASARSRHKLVSLYYEHELAQHLRESLDGTDQIAIAEAEARIQRAQMQVDAVITVWAPLIKGIFTTLKMFKESGIAEALKVQMAGTSRRATTTIFGAMRQGATARG